MLSGGRNPPTLKHAAHRGGYRTCKTKERSPGTLQKLFLMNTVTSGDYLLQNENETLDFLMRLAEALARSLAQEDNELDAALSEATSANREWL
jgi:hypothetical protein